MQNPTQNVLKDVNLSSRDKAEVAIKTNIQQSNASVIPNQFPRFSVGTHYGKKMYENPF